MNMPPSPSRRHFHCRRRFHAYLPSFVISLRCLHCHMPLSFRLIRLSASSSRLSPPADTPPAFDAITPPRRRYADFFR
jgi:hypothetical protein